MEHEIIRTETLFATAGRAFALAAGQRLRVINTDGSQVVDMWAVVPPAGSEHMSMSHTRTCLSRLVPRVGDELWSDRRRPLLRLVEDTSPGIHDTLVAACDAERYRLLGHRPYHGNCADNFRGALRAIGIAREDVPAPFNLFMHIPWHPDGELSFCPPQAAAGDYVTFEAVTDVIAVLSACPMDLNPVNGYALRDVDVQVLAPVAAPAQTQEVGA